MPQSQTCTSPTPACPRVSGVCCGAALSGCSCMAGPGLSMVSRWAQLKAGQCAQVRRQLVSNAASCHVQLCHNFRTRRPPHLPARLTSPRQAGAAAPAPTWVRLAPPFCPLATHPQPRAALQASREGDAGQPRVQRHPRASSQLLPMGPADQRLPGFACSAPQTALDPMHHATNAPWKAPCPVSPCSHSTLYLQAPAPAPAPSRWGAARQGPAGRRRLEPRRLSTGRAAGHCWRFNKVAGS